MRNRKLNINNFSTFPGKIELSDKISTMLQLWWKYGSSNIVKWNIFCCSSFFNTVKKTVITDPKQYCKKKNKNCNRFNNKHLANIYLFKIDNKNTRKRCEICSKLTIKTTERRHWPRIYFTSFSIVSIVDFEQLNVRSCTIWYHWYNLKNEKTPMEECYLNN